MKYPEEARKNKISGVVYVKFLITKEGNLDKVTVAKSVHTTLDQEVIRVVSLRREVGHLVYWEVKK